MAYSEADTKAKLITPNLSKQNQRNNKKCKICLVLNQAFRGLL